MAVQLVEFGDLRVFLRVGAHHAHAGKVFLRARGDLRKELLNFFKAHVNLLTKKLNGQGNQRHGNKQQQRQAPVDHEHQRQNYHDHENRLQRVHDHRSRELPDGREIIRGPRHQVADAMLLKKDLRLIDEVSIEILAQVVLDLARHADEYATLKKEEGAADHAGPQNFQR